MKKSFYTISVAIIVGFIAAVVLCVRALESVQVSTFDEGKTRIVLDAGHGGIDVGVSGVRTGAKESDINLAITLLLKEKLTDIGFEVELTRKTEGGLYGAPTKGFKRRDMEKRREIILQQKPALVISIHQNSYSSSTLRGAQVFYNAHSEKGQQLADGIQRELNALYAKEQVKPRKIATGEYFLLSCTPYPSVLIECGFMSNPADDELLNSDVWRKKVATSVTAGVLAYFSHAAA